MKSLILSAQDARELEKLRGLTITKPIKPAPRYIQGAAFFTEGRGEWHLETGGSRLGAGDGVADVFAAPAQTGDVVFIREPWYRLKTPGGTDSERVILAADSTVTEDSIAYRWASPVSMPEGAARRFARVKKIEPVYAENVSAWVIELETISEAEAKVQEAENAESPIESTAETPEASTEDSTEPGSAQEETPEAEADEEIGSFTLGKCKFCGREWGVTLEGAKGGGYPTQRTANAAATRLCDCEEAVKNRTPVIGVTIAITRGACKWCGQIQEVGPHPSQATADETASEVCNCPKARQERRVHEQVEDACERVNRLFGDAAERMGFKPIPDDAVGLLESVVEMIARGPVSSASINVRGQCKAKFSITSKGKIKVSRSETRSCDLEDGQ